MLLLLLKLIFLWCCRTIFWSLLDCLQLLLKFFTFLDFFGLLLSLLFILSHPFTLCQLIEALLFLQLEVECSPKLMSGVDTQSIFELLHVQLLSISSLMRLLGIYHGRCFLELLLKMLPCSLQTGLDFLLSHLILTDFGAELLL